MTVSLAPLAGEWCRGSWGGRRSCVMGWGGLLTIVSIMFMGSSLLCFTEGFCLPLLGECWRRVWEGVQREGGRDGGVLLWWVETQKYWLFCGFFTVVLLPCTQAVFYAILSLFLVDIFFHNRTCISIVLSICPWPFLSMYLLLTHYGCTISCVLNTVGTRFNFYIGICIKSEGVYKECEMLS